MAHFLFSLFFVMNGDLREIFETIKGSLFIHQLSFHTCDVTPRRARWKWTRWFGQGGA
jgi:hypothetical protein